MGLKKQLKRINELILEGSGEGRISSQSATSTASSGSYESPEAWEQGGILTKGTQPEIKGDLPPEVDITDTSTEKITIDIDDVFGKDPLTGLLDTLDSLEGGEASAVADPSLYTDDMDYPLPGGEEPILIDPDIPIRGEHPTEPDIPAEIPTKGSAYRDEEIVYDNPLWRSPPCCEPCEEKKGWWRKCRASENDNSPCQYPTISDCELADEEGESNVNPLTLSNLWGEQY